MVNRRAIFNLRKFQKLMKHIDVLTLEQRLKNNRKVQDLPVPNFDRRFFCLNYCQNYLCTVSHINLLCILICILIRHIKWSLVCKFWINLTIWRNRNILWNKFLISIEFDYLATLMTLTSNIIVSRFRNMILQMTNLSTFKSFDVNLCIWMNG